MIARVFTRPVVVLAVLGIAVGTSATVAAAVPWWANQLRTLKIQVGDCAIDSAGAIQTVTGAAATTSVVDANTKLIRGFTSTAGIFVHCTASTASVCGKPKADLSITVFSTANDAVTLRDRINSTIGNPQYIDCP